MLGSTTATRGSRRAARARPGSLAAVAILLAVAALIGGVLWPAPAGAAAAPAGAAPAVGVVTPGQIPNPATWLLEHIFVNPFRSSAKKTISSALKSSETALQTPDVSTQPRVREIWLSLLVISDSLLLLLLVIGAIMVIANNWTYLEAKVLIPRALLAALAVNLSLILLGQGIGLSNDLVRGFLQVDPNSLSQTTDRLMSSGVVAPLVLALLMIGALFLLVSSLVRIVMVVLLGVGGPILQVFGILPQTEIVARAWWRAAAAVLVAPAAQALLLTIGVKVLFPDHTALGAVGSAGSGSLVDLIMVVVIIGLMAWAPMWMVKRALSPPPRKNRLVIVGRTA